jgi:hypothetical protein
LTTAKRPASNNADALRVAQMLSRVFGAAPASTDIQALRRSNPGLDRFDWLLFIMSLEIDLKVRIPQRLVEPKAQSIAQFAKAIAALRKVTSEDHTLDTLRLLASALLGDGDSPNPRQPGGKRAR